MKTLVTAVAFAAAAAVAAAFSPASSALPTDPAAPQAFRPCYWVTAQEASDILGKPVTPEPREDEAGSNDPRCFYAASDDGFGIGISSELLQPASRAAADTMLADTAAEPGAATVNGVGVNATPNA